MKKNQEKKLEKKIIETPIPEESQPAVSTPVIKKHFTGLFLDKKNFVRIVFLLVLVVIIGSALFFFKDSLFKKDPAKEADRQAKELISKVSKLVVLPQDETPTIATVSDPEKLKSQPFFANAKTGFKVLIYTNAKKAILYDPFENKIVEIAPINLGQPAP